MVWKNCAICSTALEAETKNGNGGVRFECSRCGIFHITSVALEDIPSKRFTEVAIANLSGWIREHQNELIDSNLLDKLKNYPTPNVNEKAHKLLAWLNKETRYPSHMIQIEQSDFPELVAICWAFNQQEVVYLIDYLKEIGHIISRDAMNQTNLQITPAGFSYLDNFIKNVDSNMGFCAIWFDDEIKPVWENVIEPAIKKAGYDAKKIDEHLHNGGIVDEIIALIRRSKFFGCRFN